MTQSTAPAFTIAGVGLSQRPAVGTTTEELPELLGDAFDTLSVGPTFDGVGNTMLIFALPEAQRPRANEPGGPHNLPIFARLLMWRITSELNHPLAVCMPIYGEHAGVEAVYVAIQTLMDAPQIDAVLMLGADTQIVQSRKATFVGAAVLIRRGMACARNSAILRMSMVVAPPTIPPEKTLAEAVRRLGSQPGINVEEAKHVVIGTPAGGLSIEGVRTSLGEVCRSTWFPGVVHQPAAECGCAGAATGLYAFGFAAQLLTEAPKHTQCLWVAHAPTATMVIAVVLAGARSEPHGGRASPMENPHGPHRAVARGGQR